jgi:hypothetical protein
MSQQSLGRDIGESEEPQAAEVLPDMSSEAPAAEAPAEQKAEQQPAEEQPAEAAPAQKVG